MRRLWTALSLVALTAATMADFTGPMPIAWKWQQSTAAIPGPVDAANGIVYAGVGGRVYAIDVNTGAEQWRFPPGEALPNLFREGVTVNGGIVVAATDNGMVYGLDAASGQKKWQYSAASPVIDRATNSGKNVVLQMADSTLQVLDAATGEPAWSEPYKVTENILGSIAANDRVICFATDNNNFVILDILTKKVKSGLRFSEIAPNCDPVIHNDIAYVVSGQFIVGVELASGRARVNVNCRENLAQPPAVGDRSFTIATDEGKIRTINGQGRDIHKPIDLGGRAITAPAFAGRLVTVTTSNGNLNVIDPATGELYWNWVQRPLNKPVKGSDGKTPPNYMGAAAPAMLVGDTLLLLSRDGGLSAFDSKNGVDLTAPTVSMVWPLAGAEMNPTLVGGGMIDLFWQVDDPSSGIKASTVKVEANGKVLKHTLTPDGLLYTRMGEPGNFPGYGRMQFTITVSDWMGNTATQSFVLNFDSTLKPTPKPGTTAGGGTNTSGEGGKGSGID